MSGRLYFLRGAGDVLRARPQISFVWGYLHYLVFAALAAVGAGLEVAVEATTHRLEISDQAVALSVAVPVAVFLSVYAVLHAVLDEGSAPAVASVVGSVAAVLVIAVAAGTLRLSAVIALVAAPVVGLVVLGVVADHRNARVEALG